MQVAFVKWFALKYPNIMIYATPNAAKRSPKLGAWLKAEGMRKGVPDLTILLASGKWYLLYIELKYGKNTTTQEQKDFIAYANTHNYLAVVCWSFAEAVKVTEDYINGKL